MLVAWTRFKKVRAPENTIGTVRQLPSALKPGSPSPGTRVKTAARG